MSIKNLDKWKKQNIIVPEPESNESQSERVLKKRQPSIDPNRSIPMMYRAQVTGRCNLQFAGDISDLEQWKKEWVLPRDSQPSYQYHHEQLDSNRQNNCIYSIKFTFPYRVFSNSGQDSILRPVLTAHGIPFIPGSSVKGLFKRLKKDKPEGSEDYNLISQYCGTEEVPGNLRFHGAYPLGDWSKQMVDIVHPQQSRQVQDNNATSAYTLISFYQPEFVFEFSSANSGVVWQQVERLLPEALTSGLGGKTSTGYGFYGKPNYANPDLEAYKKALHVSFEGQGVSSTLLNKQAEFRPNMFKAALRGHMTRLLSGVCSSGGAVAQNVNSLLGDTDKEGSIKLFWESTEKPDSDKKITPKTYTTQGILHIFYDERADSGDINFIAQAVQFAYVMGGFGKSWRRIAHEKFYPEYLIEPGNGERKPNIGCHWQVDSEWVNFKDPLNVNSEDTLRLFLEDLHRICLARLASRPQAAVENWREAWHPDRVAVYSQVATQSQAVKLFHQEPFKYTPAIGGRTSDGQPTSVSSVWHRMLPIDDNQYLEIVTIFHGDCRSWRHKTEGNQLSSFVSALESKGLIFTWGSKPQQRIIQH
jgi:CRISPR-associated protein Cmr6